MALSTVVPMTNNNGIVKDWFKSSLSTGQNNCVEARIHEDGTVDVRNSKSPSGPWVSFTESEWKAFVGGAREGEFDLS